MPLRSLAVLLYLGIFQTGLAFTLHVSFSGRLASSQTGLLVLLEGILGPLWVWLFLGAVPALLTLVGGTIIIAALVVHTLVYTRVDDETIGSTV
jgi:drug/metabolite transporter (DMT)-like permease